MAKKRILVYGSFLIYLGIIIVLCVGLFFLFILPQQKDIPIFAEKSASDDYYDLKYHDRFTSSVYSTNDGYIVFSEKNMYGVTSDIIVTYYNHNNEEIWSNTYSSKELAGEIIRKKEIEDKYDNQIFRITVNDVFTTESGNLYYSLNITNDIIDNRVPIYVFTKNNSSSYQDLMNWMNSIEEKYGEYFKYVEFNTSFNKKFTSLQKEVIKKLHDDTLNDTDLYIVIGNHSWSGFQDSYKDEMISAIDNSYSNSNDDNIMLGMDSYEGFESSFNATVLVGKNKDNETILEKNYVYEYDEEYEDIVGDFYKVTSENIYFTYNDEVTILNQKNDDLSFVDMNFSTLDHNGKWNINVADYFDVGNQYIVFVETSDSKDYYHDFITLFDQDGHLKKSINLTKLLNKKNTKDSYVEVMSLIKKDNLYYAYYRSWDDENDFKEGLLILNENFKIVKHVRLQNIQYHKLKNKFFDFGTMSFDGNYLYLVYEYLDKILVRKMEKNGNNISVHIYKTHNKELFQHPLLDFSKTFLIDRGRLIIYYTLNDEDYCSSAYSRERYTLS